MSELVDGGACIFGKNLTDPKASSGTKPIDWCVAEAEINDLTWVGSVCTRPSTAQAIQERGIVAIRKVFLEIPFNTQIAEALWYRKDFWPKLTCIHDSLMKKIGLALVHSNE